MSKTVLARFCQALCSCADAVPESFRPSSISSRSAFRDFSCGGLHGSDWLLCGISQSTPIRGSCQNSQGIRGIIVFPGPFPRSRSIFGHSHANLRGRRPAPTEEKQGRTNNRKTPKKALLKL